MKVVVCDETLIDEMQESNEPWGIKQIREEAEATGYLGAGGSVDMACKMYNTLTEEELWTIKDNPEAKYEEGRTWKSGAWEDVHNDNGTINMLAALEYNREEARLKGIQKAKTEELVRDFFMENGKRELAEKMFMVFSQKELTFIYEDVYNQKVSDKV